MLALAIRLPSPSVPTLLKDDATGFLPAYLPSQRGFARLRAEFPDAAPASRAAVVFVRESGLTQADRRVIDAIALTLHARSGRLGWHVHSVTTAPHLRPLLESPNGRAGVIGVDLPAELLTHSSVSRVREIHSVVAANAPAPGLRIEVTGSAALGELLDRSAKGDIDRTTIWAFGAITLILLVIYRSPVAMLLPLVTIAVSLAVSLGLLGWAAAAGLPINGLVEMFIAVILVGSGVDYCLFLFARFREEMARTDNASMAVEIAVGRTGGAILASAATNVVGLATLALAENRDFSTSGPTIAAAICVATAVVVTLTPSLMFVAGRRLFWPIAIRAAGATDRGIWPAVGQLATRRPGVVAIVVILLLAVPAVLGLRVSPLFDTYDEYPSQSSFVRGARLYDRHFFATGGVSEQTLILTTADRLDTPTVLPVLRDALDTIASALRRDLPVVYQRDLCDPIGDSRGGVTEPTAGALDRITAALTDQIARRFYIGASGRSARIDVGLAVEPRSGAAMDLVRRLHARTVRAVGRSGLAEVSGGESVVVDLSGEGPFYADLRDVAGRDFRLVAIAATTLIGLILVVLVRSLVQSAVLISATFLTYLAAYGTTWLVFHGLYGLDGLSWQIDFLLFIIILSLGQDYNIYVVSRIREELQTRPPRDAVATAVAKTGGVVSSCGIIMAAAFASMFSGSLLLMKEFAVALSVGILIDTFLIRPLLVPSMMLLLLRSRGARSPVVDG